MTDAAPRDFDRDSEQYAADRLLDLMADHALGQLTPAETQEMNSLLAEHPQRPPHDAGALEEAAVLLAVSTCGGPDQDDMPAGLADRLRADAQSFMKTKDAEADETHPIEFAGDPSKVREIRRRVVLAFLGGGIAGGLAAAVLSVAWLNPAVQGPLPVPAPPVAVEVSSADRYAAFKQSAEDAVEFAWSVRHAGYENVAGQVAWSERDQAGFLVLDHLPENDPAEAQYQLWIVDPSRDEFPVDGGVFDVAGFVADDGRAYVPIDAKLPIRSPAAFAITLEQPGGVVKSNNPLLVVATTENRT